MKLTYQGKRHEVASVWSYTFTPHTPITWQAGQYIRLEMPGGYDTLEHSFSISSAPYQKNVVITTRTSYSDFKQSLANLAPGTIVDGHGPLGDFTWQEATQPPILVACGIGITPFHSMLKQREHEGKPLGATLIYSVRTDAIPFKDELDHWERAHPELTVIYLAAEDLDGYLVQRHVGHIGQRRIYICGPESIVRDITSQMTGEIGVDPQQILVDQFTGNLHETN